jgi:HSP20 family protein
MNETNEARTVAEQPARGPMSEERARRAPDAPRVDVRETREAFEVVADLPGVDLDGVEVTVEKDVLTIFGRPHLEDPAAYRRVYGRDPASAYRRVFSLGEEIDRDGIRATLERGVLRLTLPKARSVLPRKIEIRAA